MNDLAEHIQKPTALGSPVQWCWSAFFSKSCRHSAPAPHWSLHILETNTFSPWVQSGAAVYFTGCETEPGAGNLCSARSLFHLFHFSSSLITCPELGSFKAITHCPPGKLILVCQCDRRGNGCVGTLTKPQPAETGNLVMLRKRTHSIPT